ncbi:cobalt-precorrin-6A reductase [Synechocystis sp. LKSZ1]|uniref:cobalt-precorrin-6A reductase n=1 Tax=Synechocystis sp. LKSZ1 TaxID=3144951 RepID=UPI00336C1320
MDRGRVWLIGGTQESAILAKALAAAAIPCLVTVTTPAAQRLYAPSPYLAIQVQILQPEHLPQFLAQHQIRAIVDASHPFAAQVSQLAMAGALQYQLPYLRYERPTVPATAGVTTLASLTELLQGSYLQGQRVLLTLGAKALPHFLPWQPRAALFARILPTPTALALATQGGFQAGQLMALRPPISAALEQALWQQWQITLVVTKASGQAGGEAVKAQVAQALKIPLIRIARPSLAYPQQTDEVEVVLAFCRQLGLEGRSDVPQGLPG